LCNNPNFHGHNYELDLSVEGEIDARTGERAYQQLADVGARVVGTVLNDPGGEVAKEGDYYYPYNYAAEER
jgi:Mrp family chromosome partitioning ATPase